MEVGDAGYGHDGTDAGLGDLDFVQSVEFIEFGDFDFFLLVRVVVVDEDDFLVDAQGTVVNLADADAADVFVVVDRADEHLGRGFGVAFRSRDVVKDGFEQGNHVGGFLLQAALGKARFGRGVDEGAVELFVAGVKFQEQF